MTHLSFRRSSTPLAPKRGSWTLALNKSSNSRPTHAITLTVVGSASVPLRGPSLVFGAPLRGFLRRRPAGLSKYLFCVFWISLSYQGFWRSLWGRGGKRQPPPFHHRCSKRTMGVPDWGTTPTIRQEQVSFLGNPGVDPSIHSSFYVRKGPTSNEHVCGKSGLFDEHGQHVVPLLTLFLDQRFL